MTKTILSILAVFCFLAKQAPAIWENNARIPQVCYETVDGGQFCTDDHLGDVQVFVYNAGWCPPCNDEIGELSRAYGQFQGQRVVFASLSGEGFTRGSRPDRAFLQKWKIKHRIPFVVAGKFRDFGTAFGAPGSIPFSVVIDKQGNVAQKGFLSASEIVRIVKGLMNS